MATPKTPTNQELLIRLDEKVAGKGGLIDVVNEMKSVVATQQASLDARVIVLETFRQTKAADETISRWNRSAEVTEQLEKDYPSIMATVNWRRRIKENWKLLSVVVGIIVTILSSVAVYLINNILASTLHIGGK